MASLKNFRQILDGIDVQPLLAQLADIPTAEPNEERFPYSGPVKWRKITEWTQAKGRGVAIYNEYNIVRRYGKVQRNNITGDLIPFWAEIGNPDALSEVWPIVRAVNAAAGGDPNCVGHVIITKLPKGGKIGKHIDEAPALPGFPYWQRHQVPLFVSPGVVFGCGKEELYMKPGHAYWFNARLPHQVFNGSGRDRLTMVVEIRPMFPAHEGNLIEATHAHL